jgi:hypothetical protein
MNRKRPSLAILTDSTDDLLRGGYLIHLMIPRWEAMGFEVVVVTDKDKFVPADVALLHVDLTVIPDSCRRLAERYPVVLNGGVLDIRKRRFSRLLLDRPESWEGRVIVKTDCNYGGWREFRKRALESPIGRFGRRWGTEESVLNKFVWLEQRRPWRWKRMLLTDSYLVCTEPGLVPRGVWRNPNLIVERFAAEREGDEYCCRHWLFFGDQEVNRRSISPKAVVKVSGRLEWLSDPVPEELRKIRAQLGFDYGKFDYGIVDGEVILYDVNRTPGSSSDPSRHAETVELLCQGLRATFERNL